MPIEARGFFLLDTTLHISFLSCNHKDAKKATKCSQAQSGPADFLSSAQHHSSYWSIKWYGWMGIFDNPGKLISADRPQGQDPPAGEPSPASRPWEAEAALAAAVPCHNIMANISQGPLTGSRRRQCRLCRPCRPRTTSRGEHPAGGTAPAGGLQRSISPQVLTKAWRPPLHCRQFCSLPW